MDSSKPGFSIATRQKADLLFGPIPDVIGAAANVVLGVRDVLGYARINFLATSAQPFTILVEEACLSAGPFTETVTFSSVTDAGSGLEKVLEQVVPCGSFMRVTVTNAGAPATVSLCGAGLPHGSGAGGGTAGGRDISVRITNSVDEPVDPAAPLILSFNTEIYDTDGMHAPGSPTLLSIQRSGKYDLQASVTWATGAGTFRQLRILKNGVDVVAIGDITPIAGGQTSQEVNGAGIPLVAGDVLTLEASHDDAGLLSVVAAAGVSPIFYAKKVD